MTSRYGSLSEAQWNRRRSILQERMTACDLCPRRCNVNRRAEEAGACKLGSQPWVSSFGPHGGEESCLRGTRGSGTIFFTSCNLGCLYCQNYDISQRLHGAPVTPEILAEIMLDLQAQGCHNINLVSPTHVVAGIVEALYHAIHRGLRVPIVYNSGGYDCVRTLELLEGIIDVYLPDMKYADSPTGADLSGVSDYAAVNRAAVGEMYRQVGDLEEDANGIARRGLIIRHLVLPANLAGTSETMEFIAQELTPGTAVNLMSQYHPQHRAHSHPVLRRHLTTEEWNLAQAAARTAGLRRLL